MRATFRITRPDEIEASITVSMNLAQWKNLRDQLKNEWPSSRLSHAILTVVIAAEKQFYADEETDALR